MKSTKLYSITLIVVPFIMAFTTIRSSRVEEVVSLVPKTYSFTSPEIKLEAKEFKIKNHTTFLEDIGHKESSGRYKVVNRYGYMGKYQFGATTLKGLGYSVTKKEFLNSPKLQEEAMQKLLEHNKKRLQKYIDKYEGEVVHGVYITESGILAAAHLGGAGNVRKFFRKGSNFKDGNGTSIVTYMEKFSGYKLDL